MQDRLFHLAAEAITITAVHEGPQGWRCMVAMRRQGESWDEAYRASYSGLTTVELEEVLCNELAYRLGLA